MQSEQPTVATGHEGRRADPAGKPAGPSRKLDPVSGSDRRRRGGGDRGLLGTGRADAGITLGSIVLVAIGNTFSYRRRDHPLPWLKLALAIAVSGAFLWFFLSVSRRTSFGNLATVEGPLAVLFTWIQVTHAFDVPSRRDLGFSLAGSATLMAVAAAQAVDSTC